MPAAQWRRGGLTVPRSALAPIAAALRTARPDLAAQADAQTVRLTSKDPAALSAAGAALWPQAAIALGRLAPPADWAATGLTASDYTALAGAIEAVLHVAAEIHALAADPAPANDAGMRTVLGRTAPRGPAALSTVAAVLLARLPDVQRVVALASEATGTSPPHAADRAVDHMLDRLHQAVAGASRLDDPALAAAEAARIATLLAGLEASASTRPDHRRRIEQIRRDADALCLRLEQSAVA